MTKLIPFINQQFNQPIWRMEIDGINGLLFVEIRDSEGKKVTFGSINLITGTINFKDLAMPERWLTGIEAAYNGVLLTHNYQSANGPVHKGLVAINGITGETMWSNYTLAFDHLTINGPVVYNSQIQPPKMVLADVWSGNILRSYQPAIDPEQNHDIIAAEMLAAQALEGITLPAEPYANTVHYIEYNSYRIVSLHTFLYQQLEQHLYIFDDKGVVIYQDLLQSDIQKLQPEAFVLHKNQLIYLKNRSALIVLSL